jgi:hypothetical protein
VVRGPHEACQGEDPDQDLGNIEATHTLSTRIISPASPIGYLSLGQFQALKSEEAALRYKIGLA